MELLKKIEIGSKVIAVIHGDITDENTESIVNAANSHLKHGGGVAYAIVKKGGGIIQKESDKIGFVKTGSAAITTAGNLKCRYVIHAVGPVWGEGDEENKLSSAVYSALEIAEKHNIKSIAIPAISSGIFGFPKEKAVKIIFNTAYEFLLKSKSIEEIHFTNIDLKTSNLFLRELESIGAEGQ